jgi:hypothetical protein
MLFVLPLLIVCVLPVYIGLPWYLYTERTGHGVFPGPRCIDSSIQVDARALGMQDLNATGRRTYNRRMETHIEKNKTLTRLTIVFRCYHGQKMLARTTFYQTALDEVELGGELQGAIRYAGCNDRSKDTCTKSDKYVEHGFATEDRVPVKRFAIVENKMQARGEYDGVGKYVGASTCVGKGRRMSFCPGFRSDGPRRRRKHSPQQATDPSTRPAIELQA